jgi:hypothetical protein
VRPALLSLVCTAALSAAGARADEFSWELTGGARSSELSPATDADTATVSASYYFRPVDDEDRAYALAAFLGRASHLGASYHEDKTTSLLETFRIVGNTLVLPPGPPTTVVTRAAGREVSGRHVWRTGGWYAGGAFAEADAAHPARFPTSIGVLGDELTSRSVTFGKYVGRSTAVELSLHAASATLTRELLQPCIALSCTLVPPVRITTVIDSEIDSAGVEATHVGRLGRFDYALAGGIARSELDYTIVTTRTPPIPPPPLLPPPFGPTQPAGGVVAGVFAPAVGSGHNDRYSIAAELFPTRALGIRVSYASFDGDDMGDTSYDLAATWFFRRNIGARFQLSRTKSALAFEDVDTVGLQLLGRL